MSNRPNLKQRNRPGRPEAAPASTPLWQSPLVWVAGLIAVALAIVVGISVASDDASTANEQGFAEIIGSGLPPFQGQPDAAVGQLAPTIAAQGFDGERITVRTGDSARLYGFFAHWCGFCQRELPRVSQWLAENELPDGVEIVAISTNVERSADNYPPSAWFEREGYPFPVVVDNAANALANGFGLRNFPFWVAADAEGNIVARSSGELTTAQFEELLAAVSG